MSLNARTVWITGAAGFIGQSVVRQAVARGDVVWGIDRARPVLPALDRPALDCRALDDERFAVAPISVGALDALAARSGVPVEIIHLAGGSAVGPSFADPALDFAATVGSTLEVLDWLRRNSPKTRLVISSSAAVYGAIHTRPIGEGDARAPASPYGSHKAMMEDLAAEYVGFFGLEVRTARLFSVYGAGLRKQVLWDLCCRIAREPAIELGGTGREMRDFIHVDDAASAMLVLASSENASRVTNIATGIATPIATLTELMRQTWIDVTGACPPITFSNVTRAGDPDYLVADTTACGRLGLKQTVTIEKGANAYVRWFLAETERASA